MVPLALTSVTLPDWTPGVVGAKVIGTVTLDPGAMGTLGSNVGASVNAGFPRSGETYMGLVPLFENVTFSVDGVPNGVWGSSPEWG